MWFSFEGPEKKVTDLLEDTCTVRDDTVGKLKQPAWEGVQIPEHAALYPQSLWSKTPFLTLPNTYPFTQYLSKITID